MAKKKLKAAPKVNLQAGTTRTLYATWGKTSISKQDGYRVVWQYDTGNGVWFNGSDSTTKSTQSTYSVPSNALHARVGVAPNPGSKAKWKGALTYTKYAKAFTSESTTPSAPGTPELTIKGKDITVKVENYSDTNFNGKLAIQIIKDDSTLVYNNKNVSYSNGVATVVYKQGVIGGYRYKARAMAYGKKKEESPWSNYTNNVYTATDKPTITEIVSTGSYAVDVRWKAQRGADTYTIQYTNETVDGKPVFDTGSSAVQEQSGIIATHFPATSLSIEEDKNVWYFRLKAVNDGGDSAWSDIKSTAIGTKPDIPTIWSYVTIGKIGEDIVLNWVHNSEDGSKQSGAKVGIKINEGDETVIDTFTTETSYPYNTGSLSDGDKINWRVCTRGTQGIPEEWGDWSEYREIVVYQPPEIVFTIGVFDEEEIYSVVNQFPIHISGTATPASQTPVSYVVSITANEQYDISEENGVEVHVNKDDEIYSKYIDTSSLELDLTLNPGDIFLSRDVTYTATVTVAMTNGLTAESSQIFLAKWEIPSWNPDAEITVDKNTLVAYIRPFCSDEWEFEYRKGFTLAVYRIDFDGNLTLIDSGIRAEDNDTTCDIHPSLDYARYRIVATDNRTGVVYYDDPEPIPVNSPCAVIQWEGETRTFFADPLEIDYVANDWSGTILRLPYNINVSDDISPDVALIEYAGRKNPVSYYGTQQGFTSRWDMEIPKDDTDAIAKVRALAIYPGDVYVREPAGTGYWANVKVSYNVQYSKATIPVSLSIARVEGGA